MANYWWWKKRDAGMKALNQLLEGQEFILFCETNALMYAKNQNVLNVMKKMSTILTSTFEDIDKELGDYNKVVDCMKEITHEIDHALEMIDEADKKAEAKTKEEKTDIGSDGAKA